MVLVLKWNKNQDKSWYWSQLKWNIKTCLGIGIERNHISRQVLVLVSNKIGGLAELWRQRKSTVAQFKTMSRDKPVCAVLIQLLELTRLTSQGKEEKYFHDCEYSFIIISTAYVWNCNTKQQLLSNSYFLNLHLTWSVLPGLQLCF